MSLILFFGSLKIGAAAFSGVGDDSQEEQTDVGLGTVIGGKAPAVVASAGSRSRRRRPVRWYVPPTYPLFPETPVSIFAPPVFTGAGVSAQRRQSTRGVGRLSFEALNEQELLEILVVLDALDASDAA